MKYRKERGDRWFGIHIYYFPPWEDFLSNCISPIVRLLLDKKLITSYFFIRYFEGGPHIRLRVKCDEITFQKKARKLIIDYLENFIRENPSTLTETYISEITNNSVKLLDYEPELIRYGGEYTMQIIEDHFRDSSQHFLNLLSVRRSNLIYGEKLALVLKSHYYFICSVFSASDAVDFLYYVYTSFFQKTYSTLSPDALLKIKNSYKLMFDQYDEQLSKVFSPNLSDVDKVGGPWMIWANNIKRVDKEIANLIYQRKVEIPPFISSDDSVGEEFKAKWYIYPSLFHMTNNRFGILNRDEPYIAYILYMYLKKQNTNHNKYELL